MMTRSYSVREFCESHVEKYVKKRTLRGYVVGEITNCLGWDWGLGSRSVPWRERESAELSDIVVNRSFFMSQIIFSLSSFKMS